MRVSLSTWTAGLAIATVDAFYPYSPNYEDDQSQSKAWREQPQRRQPAMEDRASVTFPLRRVPMRRDSIYNILKSDDPKQEDGIAIDQDGIDRSYMVAVSFGDSAEEYHLLLDSAASNTWVMGQDCGTGACSTHTLFGKGDSSTLKTESTPFSIKYGTGQVSGFLASDTLHIGSLSPSVSFGLATNVSDEFRSYPMDGILGIGRGDQVDGRIEAPQVMDVLTTSNLIGSKLYGIHLSRAKDGVNDGELNFGEPNKNRYDGDLNFIPIIPNPDGFWELEVGDIGMKDTPLGVGRKTALIDTGTSFIFMPEGDAISIIDLIADAAFNKSGENFAVPCDLTRALWLEFGEQRYNISSKDWIGDDLGNGMCKCNIVGRRTFGENQWLVGDVFLKNVYTVFDFDNSQVGFGVKSGEKKEAPSSTSSGTPTSTSTSKSTATNTDAQKSPTDSPKAQSETAAAASPPSTGGADVASISSISLLVSSFISLFALLI